MNVANLNDSTDSFPHVMTNKDYNAIWRKLNNLPLNAESESIWQEVVSSNNTAFVMLFMGSFLQQHNANDTLLNSYVLGLDDDKLHCNWSKKTTMDGLKKQKYFTR